MQIAPLTVAKDPSKLDNSRLASRQQLLAGKFRRGAQVPVQPIANRVGYLRPRRMEVGLVTGRNLQNAGLDLGEASAGEPAADRRCNRAPHGQKGPPIGVAAMVPPRGKLIN